MALEMEDSAISLREQPKTSNEHCTICIEELNNPCHSDVCNHLFCFECIKDWSSVNNICPLCKRTMNVLHYELEGIHQTYVIPIANRRQLLRRSNQRRISIIRVRTRTLVQRNSTGLIIQRTYFYYSNNRQLVLRNHRHIRDFFRARFRISVQRNSVGFIIQRRYFNFSNNSWETPRNLYTDILNFIEQNMFQQSTNNRSPLLPNEQIQTAPLTSTTFVNQNISLNTHSDPNSSFNRVDNIIQPASNERLEPVIFNESHNNVENINTNEPSDEDNELSNLVESLVSNDALEYQFNTSWRTPNDLYIEILNYVDQYMSLQTASSSSPVVLPPDEQIHVTPGIPTFVNQNIPPNTHNDHSYFNRNNWSTPSNLYTEVLNYAEQYISQQTTSSSSPLSSPNEQIQIPSTSLTFINHNIPPNTHADHYSYFDGLNRDQLRSSNSSSSDDE